MAGLLWLGNVQFTAKTDDSVSVEAGPAVTNAAALLQLSQPALMAALTKRNIVARGETIVTDLKMEAAVDARDALAKATYAGVQSAAAVHADWTCAVTQDTGIQHAAHLQLLSSECTCHDMTAQCRVMAP